MTDLATKVTCTYCQEEINTVHIKCCVCQDFDICLQCFSVGAEIGPHRNDHSYRFADPCAATIFGGRGAWTGKEHLQLLDAVELYGFGNWDLISAHVETRTPEEVKEEYITRYLDGNIGKATLASVKANKPVLIDHVAESDKKISSSLTDRLPPLDVTPEEARLLGYKPHRDDYEREYNMEAEQLVSKLVLDPDEDTEMEIVLKLAIVDMYARRLRERARRKRIVRDYQLVAKYFANMRKDPQKTQQFSTEQRELRDKMRVFSQFLSSGEHERLIASLERERELRQRLSDLVRYRSLGFTSQEEIVYFEQHMGHDRKQLLRKSPESSTKRKSTGSRIEECDACSYSSTYANLVSCSTSSLHYFPLINTPEKETQENVASPETYGNISSDSPELSTKETVTQYISYSGWLPSVSS